MNLDIRLGRTEKQKLKLVKTFILGVEKFFEINKNNQYVTLTNHQGIEFNFYENLFQIGSRTMTQTINYKPNHILVMNKYHSLNFRICQFESEQGYHSLFIPQ